MSDLEERIEFQNAIEKFWQEFQAATGDPGEWIKMYVFGNSPELSEELLALILEGKKTATADMLTVFETKGEALPKPGDLNLIMNSKAEPSAVIRTVSVEQKKFSEVDGGFARDEGEGDLSLEYWRKVHKVYYEKWLGANQKEFGEDLLLICERFELLYPLDNIA